MSDTFVQSQTFRIQNRGTSAAPGNGIPFYKGNVLYQTKYHLGYSWKPSVMYALNDLAPPFQIWLGEPLLSFKIKSYDGTTVKTLNISTDLRTDSFDGYYIYTCKGVTLSPVDDCGEYRYYEVITTKPTNYYSEMWQNIDDTDDRFKGWVKLIYTNWENTTYDPENFLDYIFYGTGADQYKPYFIFEPHWARPFNEEINDSFVDGNENTHYTFRKITERQRFSVAIHDCLLSQMHQIGKHDTVTFTLIGDNVTYSIDNVIFTDESDLNDYIGRGTFSFDMTPFITTSCKTATVAEAASEAMIVVNETNQATTGTVVTTTGSNYGNLVDLSNEATATYEDTFNWFGGIVLFKITYNPTQAPGAWTFSDWHVNIAGADQTSIQAAFTGTGASYTFKDHVDGIFATCVKTGIITTASFGNSNRSITRTVTYLGDTSPQVLGALSETIFGFANITTNAGTFAWTEFDQRNAYRSSEADVAYYTSGGGSFTMSGAGTVAFWGLKGLLNANFTGLSLITDADFTKSELDDGFTLNLSNCVNLLAAQVDEIYNELEPVAINGPYTASTIDTSGTTGNATATSATARGLMVTDGITINI